MAEMELTIDQLLRSLDNLPDSAKVLTGLIGDEPRTMAILEHPKVKRMLRGLFLAVEAKGDEELESAVTVAFVGGLLVGMITPIEDAEPASGGEA